LCRILLLYNDCANVKTRQLVGVLPDMVRKSKQASLNCGGFHSDFKFPEGGFFSGELRRSVGTGWQWPPPPPLRPLLSHTQRAPGRDTVFGVCITTHVTSSLHPGVVRHPAYVRPGGGRGGAGSAPDQTPPPESGIAIHRTPDQNWSTALPPSLSR